MPVKLFMDENDLKELSNHDRIFLEVVRTHGEFKTYEKALEFGLKMALKRM